MESKVLMLYLEPTPYILGLIERLRRCCQRDVVVLFAGSNLTQQWGLKAEGHDTEALPSGFWRAFARVRHMLRSGQYRLLHLAGWGHPLLLAALLYAWWRRIPSIVESDTPHPPVVTKWKHWIKRTVYPRLFRLPALFLPGGTRQAAYLRDFGVPADRLKVAQMTVDTEAISKHVDAMTRADRDRVREQRGIDRQAVTFLFVGRLEPHKGVMQLIQAFQIVVKTTENISLLIVGNGSLLEAVQKAAQGSPRIKVAGRLSGTALWDTFGIADVFVIPSLFEPWGLVVNEALAAGLPIIATDRVGCGDDLIIDGQTGLIVPAGDHQSLAKSMELMIENAELRARMSQDARRLIAGWTLEDEARIVATAWSVVTQGAVSCSV